MDLLPQEVEVWYVLPALRRELTKAFLAKGRKQKDIALLLHITQAAVSQYTREKRGKEVQFPQEFQEEIETSSQKILSDPSCYLGELLRLSKILKDTKLICDIHRVCDKGVEAGCEVCFEN